MPCDLRQYPANWPEIRRQILLRAGGRESDPRSGARCEECGVQNYTIGYRADDGSLVCASGNAYYDERQYASSYQEASAAAEHFDAWCAQESRFVVIVLTIAHLYDPNPHNVEPANLAALCQRCHNRHDAKLRQRHAAATRVAKTGQLALWGRDRC